MVTKRRESSNPPQKQQIGSLVTRRTVQLCQVHSLASFRGVCVCCVSMSLSVLLCADMFCCVACGDGWLLLLVRRRLKSRWIFTVEAFVLVTSLLPLWNLTLHLCHMLSCVVMCGSVFIVPLALLRLWLGLSCGAASFLHLLSACFAQSGVAHDVLLVCFNPSGHWKIHQMWGPRFLLKMLLRTASRCCVVREKMCACSTKVPPPTSRSKHVSTQSATGSVTRMSCSVMQQIQT